MKTLALLLPALLLTASAAAPLAAHPMQGSTCQGPPGDVTLIVVVQGLRNSKGLVAVSLYADDKSKFLAKKGSVYVGRVEAHAPVTRVCMHLPSTGYYGLAVYHDEDSSRKINRNFIGLPTEGGGFSNNPRSLLNLPSFAQVRFHVPRSGMETVVNIRYP